MALTLTEDLIRNRVGLQHDNLEDVKSLALPGTYHEKVVSLGSSLRKFSRLKHLDLSRNNISSLQGLEHLKLLEKLNLYYNNIETLDELKKLKFNPNLKELDLRLNPVTRTETDYRLYLIHMLPNLQKLDDRSVRDRERQGALIHYSSSQATEMTNHPTREEPPSRIPNPRAEHVKTMGSGRVLDDDDVEILDLIARTGGDLSKPRPLTGSNVKEPSVEDYSIVGLKKLSRQPDDLPEQRFQPKKNKVPTEMDDVIAAYKKKYPNIPDVELFPPSDNDGPARNRDPNLEFDDEADAYNKFKSHGFFTPNPETTEDVEDNGASFITAERDSYPAPPSRIQLERTRGADPDEDLDVEPGQRQSYNRSRKDSYDQPRAEKYEENELPVQRKAPEELSASTKNVPLKSENPESRLFLFQILDLVDRYWNGSKSLHKNNKFKALAYGAVDDYLRSQAEDTSKLEVKQLKDELAEIRKENKRLRRNEDLTKSSLEDNMATEAHLKASLQKAFTDVEMLKDKIQSYAAENKRLQQKVQNQDSYGNTTNLNQTQLDELRNQNEKLKREIEKQQFQVKQFKQLQELSSMLQESHKYVKASFHFLLHDIFI
ncbi:centrosomal protein of 72 kDa-like [Ruditapes philippinarum]|uniref:centrosomal protein of 72 kDa-like n=1 Tax=Ruditapes philippinarum TaxID=129788 RepID=UPI00295B8E96|nr:centrosomal protein of 72 kDa-like [Ruditapes philippinarum]